CRYLFVYPCPLARFATAAWRFVRLRLFYVKLPCFSGWCAGFPCCYQNGGIFNDNCFLATEHQPMFKEPMAFLKAVCVLFGAFYVLNLPI
ncbi:unnamed protein product, partial [Ixodes persulcatus]